MEKIAHEYLAEHEMRSLSAVALTIMYVLKVH